MEKNGVEDVKGESAAVGTNVGEIVDVKMETDAGAVGEEFGVGVDMGRRREVSVLDMGEKEEVIVRVVEIGSLVEESKWRQDKKFVEDEGLWSRTRVLCRRRISSTGKASVSWAEPRGSESRVRGVS